MYIRLKIWQIASIILLLCEIIFQFHMKDFSVSMCFCVFDTNLAAVEIRRLLYLNLNLFWQPTSELWQRFNSNYKSGRFATFWFLIKLLLWHPSMTGLIGQMVNGNVEEKCAHLWVQRAIISQIFYHKLAFLIYLFRAHNDFYSVVVCELKIYHRIRFHSDMRVSTPPHMMQVVVSITTWVIINIPQST